MNKKPRQKIITKSEKDISVLGQLTKKELLKQSDEYDPSNYNPVDTLKEKDVLLNKNKTDVVTIRLSSQENQLISELADENGLSKSAFIRMVVKKALKNMKCTKHHPEDLMSGSDAVSWSGCVPAITSPTFLPGPRGVCPDV
jgi:predicted DNA binding CopG/RHH family protein